MLVLQATAGAPVPTWSRAAIHDTVASIVRQGVYRRDLGATLFDRIVQWVFDIIGRILGAVSDVPHGRVVATIAAAVIALLIVARVLYATRLRTPPLDAVGRRTISGGSSSAWRDAEQLAGAGQYTEAAHALYRATLAALATAGLIRLHESKTSGDYARELRRRGAPSYSAFRTFGGRYDRIIYGTGICGAEEYGILLDAARAVTAVRSIGRAA
jgi:hypothetical protein